MIDILYSYNENPSEDIIKLYRLLDIERFFGADIARYHTASPEVISKRQSVFKNLTKEPGLFVSIEKVYNKLDDLIFAFERAGIGVNKASNETALNTVCAMNSYITFIDESYEELRCYDLRAEGLKIFLELIRKEKEKPDFIKFRENVEKVSKSIKLARSVTLGINLDVNLRPMEVGLISINPLPYRSSRFMDKLLRASFNEPKDFECLCPLSSMESASSPEDLAIINSGLNKALDSVLKKHFRNLSKETRDYINSAAAEFTSIKDALSFYLNAIRFYNSAQSSGLPVCLPNVSDKVYNICRLYNHRIAMSKGEKETEPNSLQFDEAGRIYVLTGANSGGKTVFLESVTMAQALFQLGLPVFAESAVMYPFENINVYFATDSESEKNLFGRFENEAMWFADKINRKDNGKDLFIMDELFSGTSAAEAAEIALSALKMIKRKGGCGVFSTHLHELAKTVRKNGNDPDFAAFDNLSISSEDKNRPYSIRRGAPDSYESKAVTIARKYGIV